MHVARSIIETAKDCVGFLAFWKSDKSGMPSNGGLSSEAARPGMVHTVKGPLTLCTKHCLHATLNPEKWKGERLWIVALKGELAFAENKIGALEREIIGEVN
jgi:hypothetical protein